MLGKSYLIYLLCSIPLRSMYFYIKNYNFQELLTNIINITCHNRLNTIIMIHLTERALTKLTRKDISIYKFALIYIIHSLLKYIYYIPLCIFFSL